MICEDQDQTVRFIYVSDFRTVQVQDQIPSNNSKYRSRFKPSCPSGFGLGTLYREYVYSAVVYQKYLTRFRELIIIIISLNRVRYF